MGVVDNEQPPEVQEIAKGRAEDIPASFFQSLQLADERNGDGEWAPSIPVIDMARLGSMREDFSDFGGMKEAQEIAQACREWGFFQVVNHGVPEELVKRMRDLALEYFHLPPEDRVVDWAILPHPKRGRDWNDALIHFFRPALPDPVQRSNLPEGYRETMNEYVEEVLKLTTRLERVMSAMLGLRPTRFEEVMGDLQVVTRVNYYPPCARPELVTGMTAHSDFGIITVLFQNEVDGLQVLKDGCWLTVHGVPNALVINVGDMLEMLSNGEFVSSEHRVAVNSHAERLSLGLFTTTRGDLPIGPLPELIDEDHPPLYKPVSYNDYLNLGRSEGLDRKSLLKSNKIASAAT